MSRDGGAGKRKRERARAMGARGTKAPRYDFEVLARADEAFGAVVTWRTCAKTGKQTCGMDFTDWTSTKALTGAILRVEHGVVGWDVPRGHLVPTAMNRTRYVEWLEKLYRLSSPVEANEGEDVGVARVLDVGTGASVIYPLLGASTLGWRFVGTDVTDEALESARENLRKNPHLERLIEIRDARDEDGSRDRILRGVVKEGETFTFCMCNPPFFESMEDAGLNPNTACGGTEIEMVCPGGEEAFVKRMFADSLEMKESIHWFTTMCGKKSTMTKMRSLFHATRVPAVRTTELVHGKTSRWCIAWSFSKDAAGKANVPLPDAEKLKKVERTLEKRGETTD